MNPLIFIHRVNLRRSCFGIFAIVEMQIIVTFKLDSALVLAASEARVSPISLCQCICMCKKEKTNLCCFQVRGLCFSSKVIKKIQFKIPYEKNIIVFFSLDFLWFFHSLSSFFPPLFMANNKGKAFFCGFVQSQCDSL